MAMHKLKNGSKIIIDQLVFYFVITDIFFIIYFINYFDLT